MPGGVARASPGPTEKGGASCETPPFILAQRLSGDQWTPAMPFFSSGDSTSSTTPTTTPVQPMVPKIEP